MATAGREPTRRMNAIAFPWRRSLTPPKKWKQSIAAPKTPPIASRSIAPTTEELTKGVTVAE